MASLASGISLGPSIAPKPLRTSPAPGLRCSAALALGHLRATSYANAVARLLEDPEVEEGESRWAGPRPIGPRP